MTEKEFAEVYNKWCRPLVYFAGKYIGWDFAEDKAQEAFELLWKKREGFKFKSKDELMITTRQFLHQTVKNNCLKELTRSKMTERHHVLISMGEDTFEDPIQVKAELIELAIKEVEKMPSIRKNVFVKHLNGFNNSEISEIVGISYNTVTAYISLAKKTLRGLFLSYYQIEKIRHGNKGRTHCKRGHQLTPETIRINAKGIICCAKCISMASIKSSKKISSYNKFGTE